MDQHTELYGVIGYPVSHSLSPAMHNAAFETVNRNAVYLAFETKDLRGVLQGMKAFNLKGLSVTIPHKTDIIPLLDKVEDLAQKIGAVNTIVNHDGRLIGYNTDAQGALRALESKTPVAGKNCLVIGAGGAARAISFILKENGAKVTIANRSFDRGEALAKELNCPFSPLDQLVKHQAQILVQTTPVGMYPNVDQSPVPDQALKQGMVVMDIIYNPRETKLLQSARANGCDVVNGIGMFVYQGGEQFRLWTGLEPPIEIMTRVVIDSLAKAKG